MFAMDVQWLAISLGSTAVGFVAILMFACARAAGLADRYLEELAGRFELSRNRHKHHRRVPRRVRAQTERSRLLAETKKSAQSRESYLRSTAKAVGLTLDQIDTRWQRTETVT